MLGNCRTCGRRAAASSQQSNEGLSRPRTRERQATMGLRRTGEHESVEWRRSRLPRHAQPRRSRLTGDTGRDPQCPSLLPLRSAGHFPAADGPARTLPAAGTADALAAPRIRKCLFVYTTPLRNASAPSARRAKWKPHAAPGCRRCARAERPTESRDVPVAPPHL
jgi:hypothetical protein